MNPTLSSTSVPFDFSPALGLLTVGGIFGISRLRNNQKFNGK
ncbi:PFE-CTERM domain-containing protein [Hyella patelloides]